MNTVTEAEIQAITVAPRVTKDMIDKSIVRADFFTAADGIRGSSNENIPHDSHSLLTICTLVMENGWTEKGFSAPASPDNFNPEIGQRLAKEDAINKLWPLMGYELRGKLHLIEKAGKPTGAILNLGEPPTTYVGTKVVHAVPMTLGTYNKLRGWDVPHNEDPDREGYFLQYADGGEDRPVAGFDGYVSWSPKDVFERTYNTGVTLRETNFLSRLVAEFEDLEQRLSRLRSFLGSPGFQNLDPENKSDLKEQGDVMESLLNILKRRIIRLSGK